MEDEHVCIDNLVDHLDATANCPSPGAFYGVSISKHPVDL
jgi:protein phosphatase 2C family protein 2/3